jgi:hypothetical protein
LSLAKWGHRSLAVGAVVAAAAAALLGVALWRVRSGAEADGPTASGGGDDARRTSAVTNTPASRLPGLPSAVAPASSNNSETVAGPPSDGSANGADAPIGARARDGAKPTEPTPRQASTAHLSESQIMARLRKLKDQDPGAAIALAREGNRRFPDSADAPERTSILIHALSAVDRPSEARGEAEQMVNHYPDSSWVREVEMFIGAHRHRNVRVNDAGNLVYE